MRRFIILFICAFIVQMIISDNIARADPGVANLRNYYGSYPVENYEDKVSNSDPLSHELTFKLDKYNLKSEILNDKDVDRLKGKNLDIYGISFPSIKNDLRYMYGGITESKDKLKTPRKIPINLKINNTNKVVVSEMVATSKKRVTAQEIDVKLRRFLQDEYNIYGHNKSGKGRQYGTSSKFSSGFDNGQVTFHMNDQKNFSYHLFDYGTGQPDSFLRIYKDNKIIDSEKFHLDVNISLSKTS